jgi:NAD(P)H-dependent FMN reductase
MSNVKLLGILGSLSEESTTNIALWRTLDAARKRGAIVECIDLRKTPLPFRDGRRDDSTYPNSVHVLRKKIIESDGIIFASPEYNGSYTAAIKNVIDFLGPDYLRGKVAGVIGVAGDSSASNTVYHLSTILLRCGCWVLPKHVQIPMSHMIFGPDIHPLESEFNLMLEALGIDMVKSIVNFKKLPNLPKIEITM